METLGPAASLKKIFCGATRRRTIEKYPWSVLLCGTLAEAFDPPRMLTQCVHPCQRTPGDTDSRRLRWFLIDVPIERQSGLATDDIVYPAPENQSSFIKSYTPADVIAPFSLEGSQLSGPGGSTAGRGCA